MIAFAKRWSDRRKSWRWHAKVLDRGLPLLSSTAGLTRPLSSFAQWRLWPSMPDRRLALAGREFDRQSDVALRGWFLVFRPPPARARVAVEIERGDLHLVEGAAKLVAEQLQQ
eukprot:6250220-Pyramimonas_sp.AAC.1